MMRVLPFIVIVGFLALVAITFLVIVPAVERRARRNAVQDDIDAATKKWQANLTREDIERHRARMNQNLDDQFRG